jgi:DeoR family transcriptional regulator, fructose operon transcriptional repressor
MMLVADRHKQIVELVNLRSSVRVTELSERFSVTEETIRRDLEKLEKKKLLKRSHGGAVSIRDKFNEIDFSEREITKKDEKQKIAMEAVKLVNEDDRIILDASTTAWYMAKALPNIPLVVITNSIKVAMELSQKEHIRVISTGGILLQKSLSFIGPIAEEMLEKYHVTTAFISAKGVDFKAGITDSNEQQAIVKKKMIQQAQKTILMADSSKFHQIDFAKIANLKEISECITDEQLSNDTKNLLQQASIPYRIVK